jgi:hypothetical protein
MATNLISASQRVALNAVMEDIHETFAREITVFKEASQIVIITDPSFNPLYNTAGQTTSYVNTPVYKTFKVRIQYNDDIGKKYWSESGLASQIKLEAVVGSVRIKIKAEDYEYIKDGRRFDVDGKRFVLNSTFKPHGLFDNQFYTLYLKPDP